MIAALVLLLSSPVAPGSLEPPPVPAPAVTVWDRLAACESHGTWDYNPATATWGTRIFEGGLQFHPDTWDAFRDPHHPDGAHDAPRAVQIEVAERVLAAQGWAAWPACSRKLGLRP